MKFFGNALLAMLLFVMIVSVGCKSKGHKIIAVTSDTARFYPVNEYIASQISHIDSASAFLYKITVKDGIRDSAVLTKQQFKQFAQSFLEYNISDKTVHNYYKESTFMDETTKSYTINYTATDSSLPLQSVDVLLDVANSQVKRIFLSKASNTGTSSISEKDGWKNNDSFFINRVTVSNGKTTTEQNMIVWRNVP